MVEESEQAMSYPAIAPEEWVYPVMTRYKMACCDCGLVHELDFELIEDGKIRFRARRNNRSTVHVRRRMKDVSHTGINL